MERNESGYEALLAFIRRLDTIPPADIPDIDLYMDQVTTFMDTKLAAYKRAPEDSILTKTMINNYTKNKVLPVPNKKKYAPGQLKLLIALYHMKAVLTMEDIAALLAGSGGMEPAAGEPGVGTARRPDEFYEMFASLQSETMARLEREVEEGMEKTRESGFSGGEDQALARLALSLILNAAACKRVAERIIDTCM